MPRWSPTAGARIASTRTRPCACCTSEASTPGGSKTGSRNGSAPVCPLRAERETEMTKDALVDVDVLRDQVQEKYRAVASDPGKSYHFHTGRPLAQRLGYDPVIDDFLPDPAVESFDGVGDPYAL